MKRKQISDLEETLGKVSGIIGGTIGAGIGVETGYLGSSYVQGDSVDFNFEAFLAISFVPVLLSTTAFLWAGYRGGQRLGKYIDYRRMTRE